MSSQRSAALAGLPLHRVVPDADLSTSSRSWSALWRRVRDVLVPPTWRLVRAMRRGDVVELGSRDEPWERLADRAQLLGCLERSTDLVVRLDCRTDRVVDDADRLAWLDRRHSVTVAFRVGQLHPDAPRVRRLAMATRSLAMRGLDVRWVLEPASERAGTGDLLALVRTARDAGATDVRIADDANDRESWHRRLEPVRLQMGLPQMQAARG